MKAADELVTKWRKEKLPYADSVDASMVVRKHPVIEQYAALQKDIDKNKVEQSLLSKIPKLDAQIIHREWGDKKLNIDKERKILQESFPKTPSEVLYGRSLPGIFYSVEANLQNDGERSPERTQLLARVQSLRINMQDRFRERTREERLERPSLGISSEEERMADHQLIEQGRSLLADLQHEGVLHSLPVWSAWVSKKSLLADLQHEGVLSEMVPEF